MSIEQLFETIERGQVRADLRLTSTVRTLLALLEEHPMLLAARQAGPDAAAEFLRRAELIYGSSGPDGYSHPGDLALAAYLYVVARSLPTGAQALVERVAGESRLEFASATAVAAYFAERNSGATPAPNPAEELASVPVEG